MSRTHHLHQALNHEHRPERAERARELDEELLALQGQDPAALARPHHLHEEQRAADLGQRELNGRWERQAELVRAARRSMRAGARRGEGSQAQSLGGE